MIRRVFKVLVFGFFIGVVAVTVGGLWDTTVANEAHCHQFVETGIIGSRR